MEARRQYWIGFNVVPLGDVIENGATNAYYCKEKLRNMFEKTAFMIELIVLTDLKNNKIQDMYIFYRCYKTLDIFKLFVIFVPQLTRLSFFYDLVYGVH